jgi:hypothetical protein
VWTFYRFEVRAWPGTGLPVPATTYLLNVRTLVGHAQRGHGAFLMGRVSTHGWWYYFPVAFLLKTPGVTLVLLAVSAWDTVRRARWRETLPVVAFPATYFAFALTSSLNIGYRYILPMLPFLLVYAARVARVPVFPAAARRYALVGLSVLYAGVSLWLHPHYLAYFNLLAGGPAGGYRYLVDSNLDWGQDLKLLRDYLEERGVDQVWMSYLGTADPAYYGIEHRSLFAPASSQPAEGFAPFDPAPGWYAISATVLQGAYSDEPDLLDWFRRREPEARIGYSIFVYHVPPDPDPPAWLGICYAPRRILDDEELAHRFGRGDLRLVGFDCTQTWVYPAGGGPGWYFVPLASDGPGTPAVEALADAEVVHHGRGLRELPGYTVYRYDGAFSPTARDLVAEAAFSPALAPAEGDALTTAPAPLDVGAGLQFLGYRMPQEVAPGGALSVTTAWRVTARPEEPALSVFAHLVTPAGALSVGDGLGYSGIQWAPGDVFVQHNRLPLAADAPAGRAWAQVGLYALSTGERLPVEGGPTGADRLLLAPVRVRGGDS